jgi:hypothetical protein
MNSTHKYLLAALAAGTMMVSFSNAEIPAGYAGKPYPKGGSPHEIPGRINFRDYDIGGIQVSFYADDGAFGPVSGGGSAAGRDKEGTGDNAWPAFFQTWHSDHDFFFPDSNNLTTGGVRYPSPDTSISDWYIGASHATNWTKWTVHVAKAGKYWISSIWGGEDAWFDCTISFLNGTNTVKTPLNHLKGTNNYHIWRAYPDFASIQLDTGVQVLFFQNGSVHINQDFLFFAADSGQFTTAILRTPAKSKSAGSMNISLSQKTVHFSIPDAGMTKVTVFDCLGKEVSQIMNRSLAAGEHTVSISTSNLKQGVYFLHIKHNAANVVTRFQTIGK